MNHGAVLVACAVLRQLGAEAAAAAARVMDPSGGLGVSWPTYETGQMSIIWGRLVAQIPFKTLSRMIGMRHARSMLELLKIVEQTLAVVLSTMHEDARQHQLHIQPTY
jgi:hypothetical protein